MEAAGKQAYKYIFGRHDIDIGTRIRLARELEGVELERLAARIRVQPSTLGDYERGAHPIPASLLSQIAQAFDKSIAWFISGDPYMDGVLSAVDRDPAAKLAQSQAGRRLMASAARLDHDELTSIADFAVTASRGGL